ncbi:mannose-6-phosphate isomerase [Candidatus Nomurabacteria bacterium CG10_big_fil_rev_8_21_14_0_10_35_16]|uniref:Mannose-6-phosphate isomerase n=1 Tax=Candidatus Nomurabacteria bacterium CG10_big_fil_rev_8_21_14_0_10_35_16 TaxID=1974731 RepID=A0A2H0TC39_9BACT|nr:MAG: mannose-6-phosphate isomerase [Candidatus Nomurabacteria bacterium CG10_big_fil_rev_8_21_14_0_10_35_16]
MKSQRNIKTFTITKPWGKFEQFTHNETTTVKILSIKPNSSLSLQYHNQREELWYIISGHPILTIGEKKINAQPGEEFMINVLEKHRIETKDDAVQILEISYGDFDEEDIIRIEDNYGRA